jgi:hypothetical protein
MTQRMSIHFLTDGFIQTITMPTCILVSFIAATTPITQHLTDRLMVVLIKKDQRSANGPESAFTSNINSNLCRA